MSRTNLEEFLYQVQKAFYAGDVEQLCNFISIPVVVYSAVGVVVARSEDEFAKLVEDFRSALFATSVVSGDSMIATCDPLVNNRRKVTVNASNLCSTGSVVSNSVIRYFLHEKPTGYTIEMIEYLDLPLPLADIEKIVH